MLTLLFVILALAQDPPAPLTPDRPDARRAAACVAPLQRDVIDVRVSVQCRLDDRGVPSQCTASAADVLTPAQEQAAVCVAQAYRLRTPDGRLATDRQVTIPVSLRMNVSPPPPGFVPPGT